MLATIVDNGSRCDIDDGGTLQHGQCFRSVRLRIDQRRKGAVMAMSSTADHQPLMPKVLYCTVDDERTKNVEPNNKYCRSNSLAPSFARE